MDSRDRMMHDVACGHDGSGYRITRSRQRTDGSKVGAEGRKARGVETKGAVGSRLDASVCRAGTVLTACTLGSTRCTHDIFSYRSRVSSTLDSCTVYGESCK